MSSITPSRKSTVVGFFPGPQGANFSDDAVKGFEEAIKGSPLKVAVTRRGDASLNVQLDLVQNAMQAYPDINYIVAIDPGAQGAVTVLRNSRMLGKVKVDRLLTLSQPSIRTFRKATPRARS